MQWFLSVVLICISLRTVICAGLHMLICHMYIFFGEGSDQNFAHQNFLLLMLNFKSFLYILDFSPLSELPFTNIFLSLWFVFSFTWHWLSQSRSFHFNEVQLIVVYLLIFFSLWIVPLVLYVRVTVRASLVAQWLGLCASTAQGMGLIPGWGTKIPHVPWHGQNMF